MTYRGQLNRLIKNLRPIKRLRMFSALLLSNIVPKKENLMLFASGVGDFADNPKYMFLEMEEMRSDMEKVWVSEKEGVVEDLREEGFEAELSNSLKGKYLMLRANYAVFNVGMANDFSSWLALGSKRINLWHGFPYKNINSSKPEGKMIRYISEKYHNLFHVPDYFLKTNTKFDNLMRQKWNQTKNIFADYPRNDILCQKIEGSDIFAKEPLEEKYIVYMPTWRGKDSEYLQKSIEWEKLDQIFSKINMTLVMKPHPKSDLEVGEYKNIVAAENNLDIYPLLRESEALITDYSSVMFDYMHTGKPVIRFEFDKEDYDERRSLNEEAKPLVPGKEARNIEELDEALQNLDLIETDYENKINEVFESRKEGPQAKYIMKQID